MKKVCAEWWTADELSSRELFDAEPRRTAPMKWEGLNTVVLDYAGGIYIAQVQAASPAAVLPKWVSKIKHGELAAWGIGRQELAEIARSERSSRSTAAGMFGA
jgi:hypothetical protein